MNLCAARTCAQILGRAGALGTFIRIDMEDSTLTERTVGMWRWARQQGFRQGGHCHSGLPVPQRTGYLPDRPDRRRVRLCKGAYDEPADVAFPLKSDVDANYDKLATLLLEERA